MPKVKLTLLMPLITGIFVVLFDTFIFSGWLFSGFFLIAGSYLALASQNQSRRHLRNLLLSTFVATTVVGYSLQIYIKADISEFVSRHAIAPINKTKLVEGNHTQLSWVTKWFLLNYSNVDGIAKANLRIFPYSIMEYDFNKKEFVTRQYD
ncbi:MULTISPECIES: hypothetical protein [unclassified Duganella]|uniref:hypothetical protein n=1 Tax=unclassified Duganella TaxID=2636909 RepID=UPI0006FF49F5|nr:MULTISPECIES: hypothetical protein [unclassified Duganella]KQV47588.1 hypothetical protein ASD07_11645 [Duganella sp. Root336D2]